MRSCPDRPTHRSPRPTRRCGSGSVPITAARSASRPRSRSSRRTRWCSCAATRPRASPASRSSPTRGTSPPASAARSRRRRRSSGSCAASSRPLVHRPLPQLTPTNRWFWTAGADGTLRIEGCADCHKRVHPPSPVCPACRSRNRVPTVVSGRATVVGFTVNQHQWHPALEPPYAIANVALEEDASVHLTTNIVGCDPHDVHVGQRVTVRFEQHDDVWLPLFEPTGADDPVDHVGEPTRPTPRSPLTDDRFEHRAVLSGIGRSAMGRRLMVDPLSLTVDAFLAAVADAGLPLDDLDV